LLAARQLISLRNNGHAVAADQRDNGAESRGFDTRRRSGFVEQFLIEAACLIFRVVNQLCIEAGQKQMIGMEAGSLR
jgi:hypothetical protein